MSPPALRRYRAERLLEREFEGLRAQVLGSVRARLRTSGVRGELVDLEACYAIAWQGLYAATLQGQLIANPAGWLVMVTFRRAIDEHRALLHRTPTGEAERLDASDSHPGAELDLVEELENRARLRHVFEALRGRLNERESEAAVLCYLQGLPRAEAAERMGISLASMARLMDGRGPGRPGVASKVAELLETINAGGWCEEQASLMRGLAFEVLDPKGERYRLALAHLRDCPACRAYVVSLRGLAAVLPPLLLPLGAWGTAGAGAGAGAAGAGGAGTGAAAGTGSAVSTIGASAGAGAGAGSGWLFAGAGVKLAAGCLLALGLGAGCITLALHPGSGPAKRAPLHHATQTPIRRPAASPSSAPQTSTASGLPRSAPPKRAAATSQAARPVRRAAPATRQRPAPARREFGIERPARAVRRTRRPAPQARAAAREFAPIQSQVPGVSSAEVPTVARSAASGSAHGGSAASREFGIR